VSSQLRCRLGCQGPGQGRSGGTGQVGCSLHKPQGAGRSASRLGAGRRRQL